MPSAHDVYYAGLEYDRMVDADTKGVPCPKCGVPAGQHCITNSGKRAGLMHIDRQMDGFKAHNAGTCACGTPDRSILHPHGRPQ